MWRKTFKIKEHNNRRPQFDYKSGNSRWHLTIVCNIKKFDLKKNERLNLTELLRFEDTKKFNSIFIKHVHSKVSKNQLWLLFYILTSFHTQKMVGIQLVEEDNLIDFKEVYCLFHWCIRVGYLCIIFVSMHSIFALPGGCHECILKKEGVSHIGLVFWWRDGDACLQKW